MYHPEALLLSGSPLPASYQPALKHGYFDKYLDCPDLPKQRVVVPEKSSLRVLTSSDNLKRIEEKGKEKLKKAQEKEERAKLREEKRLLKEQQRLLKQQQKGSQVNRKQKTQQKSITFSENEVAKFVQRYENGYDITTDECYNLWLKVFHPSEVRTTLLYSKCLSI